jgi:hypothetical protein
MRRRMRCAATEKRDSSALGAHAHAVAALLPSMGQDRPGGCEGPRGCEDARASMRGSGRRNVASVARWVRGQSCWLPVVYQCTYIHAVARAEKKKMASVAFTGRFVVLVTVGCRAGDGWLSRISVRTSTRDTQRIHFDFFCLASIQLL